MGMFTFDCALCHKPIKPREFMGMIWFKDNKPYERVVGFNDLYGLSGEWQNWEAVCDDIFNKDPTNGLCVFHVDCNLEEDLTLINSRIHQNY